METLILYGIFLLMVAPRAAETPEASTIWPEDGTDGDIPASPNASHLLNNLLATMDPRVRPNTDGPPVEVVCGFYITSFGSISEINMDYSIDIYMRQTWVDDRLRFSGGSKPLILPGKGMENVWVPDLFFPNEKSAAFHYVTMPNKLMRLHPNGTIQYSVRITLTLSCPMLLSHFPMDYQECLFKIESYGYEINEMILVWANERAIEISDDLELPQFDLVEVSAAELIRVYTTGKFPGLEVKFGLQRQFGFYLLQTYIPSILIVILSWVSFWINYDAIPARISLGVTTVLTMATQLSGSKASIPKVSYPKAIDVWMSMCMLFVFGALLEYAFVNVLARKNSEQRKDHVTQDKKTKEPENGKDLHGENNEMASVVEFEPEERNVSRRCPPFTLPDCMRPRGAASNVDRCAKILFPGAFIVFNIFYWSVYTNQRV